MSFSNQQTLAESGATDRPLILEKGNYTPWESQFRRFLENKGKIGSICGIQLSKDLINHYIEPTELEIQEMVNILVSGEAYDKVFNYLVMLHVPLEGKGEYEERMRYSITKGPYVRQMIDDPDNPDDHNKMIPELVSKMTEANKKHYSNDVRVMNYLLQAILNDIYNLMDACKDT
ncbi:hypothetical protein Tco_0421551 [Tanacetum coccineum]